MTCRFLPLLIAIGGCTEASDFLPKVSFDRLEVREIDWTDIQTDFVFRVDNPNPVRVGVASFAYDFSLVDISLLSGDNADGFRLPADGATDLVLPVDLNFQDTWNSVKATRGLDEVPFGLSGQFGFDTPIGRVRIPYDEEGSFPALRTPQIRFDALRVSEVSLTEAKLELDLGVDNPHGSTLFFDNFAYALSLEDIPVASGMVQTFDVHGDSEGVITLPISIDLLSGAAATLDLILNGGQADMGIAASTDVETPFGVLPLTIDTSSPLELDAP